MLSVQCYACKEVLRGADIATVVRAAVAPELPWRTESFHARCWLLLHQRQRVSLAVPAARRRRVARGAAQYQA